MKSSPYDALLTTAEMERLLAELYEGCPLPNGCWLYVSDDPVGGREYASDEVGGGAPVWNTSTIDQSTLLAAITHESRIDYLEREIAKRKARANQ